MGLREAVCARLTAKNVATFAGGLALLALFGTLVEAFGTLQLKDAELLQAKASNEKMACWLLENEKPKSRAERRTALQDMWLKGQEGALCRSPTDPECLWWGPRYSACGTNISDRDPFRRLPEDVSQDGFLKSDRSRITAGSDTAHRYWLGKVPHYGIDPKTGQSFGTSIAGAEMVARGSDLFVYGGFDSVNGARHWLMHADFLQVAKEGNLTWRYIDIGFAEGKVNSVECPRAVYGHQMTRMGYETPDEIPGSPVLYFISGGHTQREFRNESSKWGYLEISRQPDQPWSARWTSCGQVSASARAWHSAVWLGGPNHTEGQQNMIALCGGVRKKGNSVAALQWDTHFRTFTETGTVGINGLPCNRYGHTALKIRDSNKGRFAFVFGGANLSKSGQVKEGLTWKGSDRIELHIYDSKVLSFTNPFASPQTCSDAVRDGLAMARMHKSAQMGRQSVLLVGGGHQGGAGISLLRWQMDARPDEWFWVEKLRPGDLPCGETTKLHSAWMPPLARHSMARIGTDKIVIYGGKVAGSEDFHGMMLLRLMP